MDATLQKHYAKFIYVVPDGLRELMRDISREVLRSQPNDIYTFVADYLDALIITRENARVASRLVSNIINISETTSKILETRGIDKKRAEKAAMIIQRKFRIFSDSTKEKELPSSEQILQEILDEANLTKEQAESAAEVIQKAFRSFMYMKKKENELLGSTIDWRTSARSAIALYRKTGATPQEVNRAATLIKSAYKGYYTRRILRNLETTAAREFSEECICESYSLDVPASTTEYRKPVSQECVCSVNTDEIMDVMSEGECYCEYTTSEIMLIQKGEKYISDAGFTPVADVESDDLPCYCEETERDQLNKKNMMEPVDVNENPVGDLNYIYERKKEDDATNAFAEEQ